MVSNIVFIAVHGLDGTFTEHPRDEGGTHRSSATNGPVGTALVTVPTRTTGPDGRCTGLLDRDRWPWPRIPRTFLESQGLQVLSHRHDHY